MKGREKRRDNGKEEERKKKPGQPPKEQRCSPIRSSNEGIPALVSPFCDGRDTKICEFDLSGGGQQDVSTLDITMNDPNPMQVLKPLMQQNNNNNKNSEFLLPKAKREEKEKEKEKEKRP